MANKNLNISPSYHEHVADNVLLNGLLIADGVHIHIADNIDLPVHCLTALDGYLVHVADACDVSPNWHATTLQDDGKSYPYLPVLECTAETGKRGELDEMLPGIELTDMRAGARMSTDPNLPVLECSATAQGETIASLDKRLPSLEATGRFGTRADDLILPDMRLDITMIGDLLLWLDKMLPGLTITADGSTPILATLIKDLPALEISASASAVVTGQLDRDLPALKITANALAGAAGVLNGILPALEMDSDSGLYGDQLNLTATLPAIVMAPLATGSFGGQPGELVDASRFTDYVLRYER
jgi:hypothetical protein